MNDRRRVLQASASSAVTAASAAAVIADGLAELPRDASRVLVLAPDDTRKLPVSQTFRAVWKALQGRAASVDVMIAQGTHASMPEAAKRQWVFGADAYPEVAIHDHEWARADALVDIGSVPLAEQLARFGEYGDLAPGLGFDRDMPVRINRRLLDYDRVILITRVQPHEGAGFAGGAKQIFPGVSGPEMINLLHTIGSLRGARAIQGVLDNPVRELIDDMTRQVPVPLTTIALVIDDASGATRGVFVEPDGWREATRAAAALSAEVNIRTTARRVARAVAATPRLPDGSWMYPELWTGAKGVFRGDDTVADGGELVLYAPGVREISATHGRAIRQVGLHGWPYLLAHPEAWQPHGRQSPGAHAGRVDQGRRAPGGRTRDAAHRRPPGHGHSAGRMPRARRGLREPGPGGARDRGGSGRRHRRRPSRHAQRGQRPVAVSVGQRRVTVLGRPGPGGAGRCVSSDGSRPDPGIMVEERPVATWTRRPGQES